MTKRGIALILSYMVIAALTALSVGMLGRSISENGIAARYANSARAFWIAEAGLAQTYYNWRSNIAQPSPPSVNFGGGSYTITSYDLPLVKITGTYANVSRAVQASFVRIPSPFENTISAGGDLSLFGLFARVEIYDKTRISGSYTKTAGARDFFEDKQEHVSQDTTTIMVPDYDNNGTPDQFSDFVAFGNNVVDSYPSSQVVHVQTNGTANIFPSSSLAGKKVIFVEGSSPGTGNANIFFDGTWQENEDLTVISTGNITYIEPLQFQENARLSTVSWNNYNEGSIFRSQHESVIYAHNDANFIDILDWGSTTGNVIVNDDISLKEVLTYEKYFYSDRAQGGDMPPGFKWLSGATGKPVLMDWQETF